nr:MAG TPA: hypothetical protein [Caudoviricetes sp.]
MKPHPNPCPKADRCIHAAECICYDTFCGEYLCFERSDFNQVEYQRRTKVKARKGKSKCQSTRKRS